VNVEGTQNQVLNPPMHGGPQNSPLLLITIFRFDQATNTPLENAIGLTDQLNLTVGYKLSSASLQGIVPMDDLVNNVLYDAEVNLSFAATSGIMSNKSEDHTHESGLVVNAFFNGTFTLASATGTIIGRNINFTPFESTFAEIQNNESGTITVRTTTK
jgi:hypothetical protein